MARRASGFQTWRFYQVYGLLEFRMNNLSDAEDAVVRRYLGTLTVLEFAVPRAGDNLDTDQAAVWTRNRDELRDRTQAVRRLAPAAVRFLRRSAGAGDD